MGMFLSLTGIIGKTKDEVVSSLAKYAVSVGGGLEKENLPAELDYRCVIDEANGHTTILYPDAYGEWDASSEFISRDLNAPVFSLHVHDGDLWMYVLFVNGDRADQFNPVPGYWDDTLSEGELQSWQGNAATVCRYVTSMKPSDIERYLVSWDLEAAESIRSYPEDVYGQEDFQLLDFMKKLGLPFPLDDDMNPIGETFKLWTKDLPLKAPIFRSHEAATPPPQSLTPRKWWKFW